MKINKREQDNTGFQMSDSQWQQWGSLGNERKFDPVYEGVWAN